MKSVSKLKIVLSYVLLLAVLIFSLLFVHREVETLTLSEENDVQWMDSLLTLLREKDANTIVMLRMMSEVNESMISTREIEHLIAAQDTQLIQQRVQRRVISHRDTVVTKQRKKGFFRRLGEVFVPPKKDSAIQVKTSLEFEVDTVISLYNPVDSLQQKLRAVTEKRRADSIIVQRRNRSLQRMNRLLTVRIDSLLKSYEEETLEQARQEAEKQQEVRQRSVLTIGWVAGGGVLLAAFFLILIIRDVTRSNRYRYELEVARKRAEDLLVTREKLMLAITHDFKAPLGSIIGYADLLSRLTTDERQRFYLDNMKTSSEHLLKLVVDLLDFHRLDLRKTEINRVSFYPSRLLEEIRVSFEPLVAAKGLTLYCQIDSSLQQAYVCDPLRLRQIITNLMSNAIKFTDEGSITMNASFKNRRLVVAISDTGRGMEATDKERIFQEFTRLSSAQGKEGFGLGLSIVRMLVQLLEGEIEVESVPDEGSTFTVYIPIFPVVVEEHSAEALLQKSEATVVEKNLSDTSSSATLSKVLLIDDDRIQLSLTKAMLSHSGIESVGCLQLDELLNALRTESFDVLLTDVQMPAISGFDLLTLLRASNIAQAKTIPVLAVTARSDIKREEFIQSGFSGCLHKPFTIKELLQEMKGKVCGEVEKEVVVKTGLNWSALTAFSEDDPEASASIMNSFISETQLNKERLHRGLDEQDIEELAAVSHKMIPVFTMIGASQLVGLLKQLEAARGSVYNEELMACGQKALVYIEEVLADLEVEGF